MQLMMLGGRSKVPQNRLVVLRQKREAVRFILRPGANVRRGQVARIVHVEAKQCAHFGLGKQVLRLLQPFAPQTVKINAVFPIDRHRSISWQCHKILLSCGAGILARPGYDLPHSARAASNTVCSVGTVTSSNGGENGIGTCIAPIRFTGASKSKKAFSWITDADRKSTR